MPLHQLDYYCPAGAWCVVVKWPAIGRQQTTPVSPVLPCETRSCPSPEELRHIFTAAGLEEVQNLVDRRLQVNRGRQIKMYRVWNQCKYRRPLEPPPPPPLSETETVPGQSR